MNGLGRHLLLELFDCDGAALNNLNGVKRALIEAAERAHATIVEVVFHQFSPIGVSGVVVIAESHLSIHTWPEYGYAAVDLFSCAEKLRMEEATASLIETFRPRRTAMVTVDRGIVSREGLRPEPERLLDGGRFVMN